MGNLKNMSSIQVIIAPSNEGYMNMLYTLDFAKVKKKMEPVKKKC